MTALLAIGRWCLDNWHVVAVAALVLGLAGWAVKNGMQRDAVTVEYADFRRDVAKAAQAAAERALKQTIEDEERKEKADVENLRLRAANDALSRRLRDARASSRFVPPAAPGAASPAVATIDREALERALQQLDARVSDLIAEGDRAIVDLETARRWAQERP